MTEDNDRYALEHEQILDLIALRQPLIGTTTVVKLDPNSTEELLKWIGFLSDPAQPDVISIPRNDLRQLLEMVRART